MAPSKDDRAVPGRKPRAWVPALVVAACLAACATGPRGADPTVQTSSPRPPADGSALTDDTAARPPATGIPPLVEPSEAPPLASARPAEPIGSPKTTTCRPMAFVPGECDPRPHDDAFRAGEEVDGWFRQRGAKRPPNPPGSSEGSCFVLPPTNGGEEAMVCASTRIESKSFARGGPAAYRRVDRVRAYVVRNRNVVTVLDAPLLFDAMDKEDLSDGPFFSLRVARDAQGKPLVREPSEGACERARAHNAGNYAQAGDDPQLRHWARFDEGLLERLCRAANVPKPRTVRASGSWGSD